MPRANTNILPWRLCTNQFTLEAYFNGAVSGLVKERELVSRANQSHVEKQSSSHLDSEPHTLLAQVADEEAESPINVPRCALASRVHQKVLYLLGPSSEVNLDHGKSPHPTFGLSESGAIS
jgi:hypothetical protein